MSAQKYATDRLAARTAERLLAPSRGKGADHPPSLRSKLVKAFSWQTPFYDRFFVIGAFLISIASLFLPVLLENNDAGRLSAAVLSTALGTLVLAVMAFSLVRQLSTARAELLRSKMAEDAASTIANSFCSLVKLQTEFETAVATFVTNTTDEPRDGTFIYRLDKSYDTVRNASNAFAVALVETASDVLTTRKGHPNDKCTANLKIFRRAQDGTLNVVYDVLHRSNHAHYTRKDKDKIARRPPNEPRLESNRMYHWVLTEHQPLPVPDLHVYVQQTEAINDEYRKKYKRLRYTEPTLDSLGDYQSCLLIPVYGTDPLLRMLRRHEVVGQPITLPFGAEDSLVGLLCIDSTELNYFDSTFDEVIMTQLSVHAFSVIRTFYTVHALYNHYTSRDDGLPSVRDP